MASLLQLKRRIRAAQNVSKTTRAMQMIAASKLKKAQDATLSMRPYTDKLLSLTQRITQTTKKEFQHPYLKKRINGKTLLIFFSPDKGLCGALITNLFREFLRFTDEEKGPSIVVVGKKIEGHVVKLKNEVIASFNFGTTLPTFDMVYPISRIIDEYYLSNQVDSVKILYSHFASIFTQTPKITPLLPVEMPQEQIEIGFTLFEPSTNAILPKLLKHYLEMILYQSLLESFVSEQASRMIAMQNATNNARDIIEDLLLEYNKTRQSKITSEILDISSGRINQNEQ